MHLQSLEVTINFKQWKNEPLDQRCTNFPNKNTPKKTVAKTKEGFPTRQSSFQKPPQQLEASTFPNKYIPQVLQETFQNNNQQII